MRYPVSEKLEIIRLVERSHLPVRRTLEKLGIPRTAFYRWYDRYQSVGEAGLEDRSPHPGRVWNRIPDDVREPLVRLALDEPELSPRELAVSFTDTERHYLLEASVYRILKAQDLIASPDMDTLELALEASGCDRLTVRHRPRLLSDNGSSHIAREPPTWLKDKVMDHVRGAPTTPRRRARLSAGQQTLKSRILLENH